jgi:hypothetical protein
MAIDLVTPIASAAEFRDRNGMLSSNDDSMVETLLLTVTRLIERRIGVAPGMLLPQTSLAFTFSATGGSRLYLRDDRGFQYLLRSITTDKLEIDDDADGSFDDYTLDTADAWVSAFPVNAATFLEPYTAIDLLNITTATITAWPKARNCVQITGNWGVAANSAIRAALKERAISIVRELIDTHRAGAAMSVDAMGSAVESVPAARALMHMIEREYNYRSPSFG